MYLHAMQKHSGFCVSFQFLFDFQPLMSWTPSLELCYHDTIILSNLSQIKWLWRSWIGQGWMLKPSVFSPGRSAAWRPCTTQMWSVCTRSWKRRDASTSCWSMQEEETSTAGYAARENCQTMPARSPSPRSSLPSNIWSVMLKAFRARCCLCFPSCSLVMCSVKSHLLTCETHTRCHLLQMCHGCWQSSVWFEGEGAAWVERAGGRTHDRRWLTVNKPDYNLPCSHRNANWIFTEKLADQRWANS